LKTGDKVIKVGQARQVRYWGAFDVIKVAKLQKPILCHSEEVGEVEFNPVLAYIMWCSRPPCEEDPNWFWFPYWITVKGKQRYGQFAPMIGEKALLELLEEAIKQDFFSEAFLRRLALKIEGHLRKSKEGQDRLSK
jgi:hypothetical protein